MIIGEPLISTVTGKRYNSRPVISTQKLSKNKPHISLNANTVTTTCPLGASDPFYGLHNIATPKLLLK